jgi:hypothetical protein
LVLEAQLIFKLKRPNGAEGYSAIDSYDLDISPDGNRQKGDTPSVNPKFFLKYGLRVRAQPPHFSWLRPTPNPHSHWCNHAKPTRQDSEQLQRRSSKHT